MHTYGDFVPSLSILALVWTSIGCSSPVPGADPQCAATNPASGSTYESTVAFGRMSGNGFSALEAGGEVAVVHGFQGGTWIMPAMRLTGVTADGHMVASLTLVEGLLLGRSELDLRLDLQPDGSLLLEYLPVPAPQVEGLPALAEIDGSQATLDATFKDVCGKEAMRSSVVLLKVQE
jgi:hypothetical protein